MFSLQTYIFENILVNLPKYDGTFVDVKKYMELFLNPKDEKNRMALNR